MKWRAFAALVIMVATAVPVAAQPGGGAVPQGPLAAARDLYASARYDEALTVLNSLRSGEPGDRKSVEQYRSLCLLALGRTTEADAAIAAVITADPLYSPGQSEASPRVRATFAEVRRRLLPELIAARYATAKGSYDRKDWAAAEEEFRTVLTLVDDPDAGGRFNDLRVLAVGFLELSARAAAPPPAPEPKPAAVPADPAPAAAPVPSPAAASLPAPDRVFGVDDADVQAPVVVRQEVPRIPQPLIALAKPRGLLEVVVDEQGRVIQMSMRAPIHPSYDAMVLTAARDWKYEPARLGGQPVKFRRVIAIAVKPR